MGDVGVFGDHSWCGAGDEVWEEEVWDCQMQGLEGGGGEGEYVSGGEGVGEDGGSVEAEEGVWEEEF